MEERRACEPCFVAHTRLLRLVMLGHALMAAAEPFAALGRVSLVRRLPLIQVPRLVQSIDVLAHVEKALV